MGMVNGKPSPCKDCEKRHPGCHSHCEGYEKFKAYIKMINDRRWKEQMADQTYYKMKKRWQY